MEKNKILSDDELAQNCESCQDHVCNDFCGCFSDVDNFDYSFLNDEDIKFIDYLQKNFLSVRNIKSLNYDSKIDCIIVSPIKFLPTNIQDTKNIFIDWQKENFIIRNFDAKKFIHTYNKIYSAIK